ncbi:MAG TPA: T9SS type A sorting domain-containing protein, partial [Bacteroidia bacterium]|nr:T9SS type A sorting domain-containing protein [Bacteroidia bacterium]
ILYNNNKKTNSMKNYVTVFALLILSVKVNSQTVQPNIPTANDRVNCIVRYNNTIYIGGEFDTVGTSARPYLAAIDANTGAILPWNPVPNAQVTKMIICNSKLVVLGDFSSISGSLIDRIAVYDLQSGNLLNLNSIPLNLIGIGRYGLYNAGNFVYFTASDIFGSVDAVRRFDLNTLLLDTIWVSSNFNVNKCELISSGNYIYAAGWFNHYLTNSTIKNLCRFDMLTGIIDTTFSFSFSNSDYLNQIAAQNGKLYVSGNFSAIDGLTRKGIAEIDTSGFVTSKNIYCSNSLIDALTLQGNTLWVGGNSVVLGGLNRYCIAQIDISTGIATCWFTQALQGNVYMTSIWASHDTIYSAPNIEGFKTFTGNPGFVNIGNDSVLCAGSSLMLNAPNGLTNYLWNTGATTSSITVNAPGSYWFSATGSGGCIVTGYRILSACTGIENQISLVPIQILPTISNGIYSIQFPLQKVSGIIKLHDSSGNLVRTFSTSPLENAKQLNISSLASGIYFCSVVWESKISIVLKLVKE